MPTNALLERITDRSVLDAQLTALVAQAPELKQILDVCSDVPLRLSEGGFAGMMQIVTAQLLSVASAGAINKRLRDALGDLTARRFLELSDEDLKTCGLSRSKIVCLQNVARSELCGELDYDGLAALPVDDALRKLTVLKGIGKWTAEVYLLFCTGHPDIFPAGDLALQKGLGYALKLSEKPSEKDTRHIVADWSPYRGAAARLIWRYFAFVKTREGVTL